MNLSTQLRVGRAQPEPTLLRPVNNTDDCLGAKPKGGLWTSSYSREHGSDWIRWCESEDFRVPGTWHGPSTWRGWLLEPDEFARVLVIDSLRTLRSVLKQYWRLSLFAPIDSPKLDFEKLAQDFDAVSLTEKAEWATRHSEPNLYGWDCESTVWFRWCFTTVRAISIPVRTGVYA